MNHGVAYYHSDDDVAYTHAHRHETGHPIAETEAIDQARKVQLLQTRADQTSNVDVDPANADAPDDAIGEMDRYSSFPSCLHSQR
jgi:hypothetical protein